jgi:hypothetical protein
VASDVELCEWAHSDTARSSGSRMLANVNVGGTYGYREYLETLRNPDHEERDEISYPTLVPRRFIGRGIPQD